MEHINSTATRQISSRENMRALEKACLEADIRVNLRKVAETRARFFLGAFISVTFSTYFLYHFFAPGGVMQNHRTSQGAYMHYMQTFMFRQKSTTDMLRPEILLKEQNSSLGQYARRIENQRKEGTAAEGVHHPTTWL